MTQYSASLCRHALTCRIIKNTGGAKRSIILRFRQLFCTSTLSNNAMYNIAATVPVPVPLSLSLTSRGIRRSSENDSNNGSNNGNNDNEDERRIVATQKWLKSIVIGKKLCPFASPVSRAPKLRIFASRASNYDDIVREIATEAHLLVGTDKHTVEEASFNSNSNSNSNSNITNKLSTATSIQRPETTLIVLNERLCTPLLQFQNLVRLSWTIQSEAIVANGLLGKLQIVLFHPRASHNTYSERPDEDDAADYTIRSPYPTIHLLREADVMRAVKGGFPDLEGLPSRNKALLRTDGVHICKDRLNACKGPSSQ